MFPSPTGYTMTYTRAILGSPLANQPLGEARGVAGQEAVVWPLAIHQRRQGLMSMLDATLNLVGAWF